MNLFRKHLNQTGQTMVLLLVLLAVGMTVIAASIAVTVANTQSTSQFSLAQEAYSIAETGAEEALIRLLRNPGYTGTSTPINIGGGQVSITVSGVDPKTIVSEGVVLNLRRKVSVVVNMSPQLSIQSWVEVD